MATATGKGKGRPFQAVWCDRVAADDRLNRTDVAVAWRIASYADADGTNAYPTNLRLARECRLKVSTDPKSPDKGGRSQAVERALKRLRAMGYLERAVHPNDERRWVYRLTLPAGITPVSGDRGQGKGPDPDLATNPAVFQEATRDEPRSPATLNPGHWGPATNPGTSPGTTPTAPSRGPAADAAPGDTPGAHETEAEELARKTAAANGLKAVRAAVVRQVRTEHRTSPPGEPT